MAQVITIGIQKGGQGKTTTTGAVAYLMAEEGYKVLVVDLDSQGNCTSYLTGKDDAEFEGNALYDAFMERNAKKYIVPTLIDGVDLLAGEDTLSGLTEYLYEQYKPQFNAPVSVALYELLMPIQDEYDFILIDTPPTLGEYMMNALVATDHVVVLAESAEWAFNAIPKYLKSVQAAHDNINPNVKVTGILRTLTLRNSDSENYKKQIADKYPDLIFKTVIHRRAATSRLASKRFIDNPELRKAMEFYKPFYWELKSRLGMKANVK